MAPQEKDVVFAIHEDARMQLKPLVAKFKTTFTEKGDKDVFMAIVKRVAKFVQEGEDRFVRLNDGTLDQYGLRAPQPAAKESSGAASAAGTASAAGSSGHDSAPEPVAKESSGSSGHDSGRVPVAEDGGETSAASADPASPSGRAADGCASSSHGVPVVDEKLMRRLAEQSDKLDTGYSAIENCGSQAPALA